jgi:CheY-like chemotaxis protein
MRPLSEVHVLIVDDEADLLDLHSQLFKGFGFFVARAENGRTALEILECQKMDLILTDIRMPQMDGIELLKKVREKDPNAPSVLITSGFINYTIADLYHFGANGFFTKPFGAAAVRNAVSRTLLTRDVRWGQGSMDTIHANIERSFPSFEAIHASGVVKIGSGGFFFRGTGLNLRVNENISFQFKFEMPTLFEKLEGTGVVRWIKGANSESGPAGAGVEIKSLTNACREKFCAWLNKQNFVAFIPQA